MRRAYNNKKLIINDNNIFIGISLGYDFTAEHEWGIKDLRRLFNMNESEIGIKRRTTNNPKGVVMQIHKDGQLAVLKTSSKYYFDEDNKKTFEQLLNSELNTSNIKRTEGEPFLFKNVVETAWSGSDFGVIANVEYIKELYDAFQRNDVAITSIKSSDNCFEGTSLSLVIISRLPQDVIDMFSYVDNKDLDLIKYEEKIGMTKLKEKTYQSKYSSEKSDKPYTKYWMALSPRWINYKNEKPEFKKENNTEYDIKYWVNYGDDETYGWFTVEQIKEWLSTKDLKLSSFGGSKG